jgi:hypothetical protein
MATILEFRMTEHDGARKQAPDERVLGEIIILPGVRIERHGAQEQTMSTAVEELAAEARSKSQG